MHLLFRLLSFVITYEWWCTNVHRPSTDDQKEGQGREPREEKLKPVEEEGASRTDQDSESKKSSDDFEIKKKEDTVQKKRKYRSNKESDDELDKVSI